jgi:hypothetical protein
MSAKLFYRLRSGLSRMVLTDAGSSPAAVLPVYQSPYTGATNQQWWARVVDQGMGLLVIGSRSSGAVLAPGAPNPGGMPELVTRAEPDDWQWAWNPIPVRGDDGAVRFVLKFFRRNGDGAETDGTVIDLPIDEHDLDDGARIQIFPENDGSNQQWSMDIVGDNYFASILPARSTGYVMGLPVGGVDDTYPIEQRRYRGIPGHEWILRPVDLDSGVVKLQSVATGLVVQVEYAASEDPQAGTEIAQYPDDHQQPYNHYSRQQWKLVSADGAYAIVSQFDSRVVDVSGDSGDEGTTLQVYPDHGGDNQRWFPRSVFESDVLDPEAGPIFEIVSKLGKAMSVGADGWIVQQGSRGAAEQQWQVLTYVDGYSSIYSVADRRVLDLPLPDPPVGQQIQAYEDNGGANQQWAIVPTDEGDGWYKIVSRQTGLVLDVRGNSTEDGAEVQQFTDKGGNYDGNADNQRWRFILRNM